MAVASGTWEGKGEDSRWASIQRLQVCSVALLYVCLYLLITISYKSEVEAIIDSACQEQHLEVQLNDIEEEWSEQVGVRVCACVGG